MYTYGVLSLQFDCSKPHTGGSLQSLQLLDTVESIGLLYYTLSRTQTGIVLLHPRPSPAASSGSRNTSSSLTGTAPTQITCPSSLHPPLPLPTLRATWLPAGKGGSHPHSFGREVKKDKVVNTITLNCTCSYLRFLRVLEFLLHTDSLNSKDSCIILHLSSLSRTAYTQQLEPFHNLPEPVVLSESQVVRETLW